MRGIAPNFGFIGCLRLASPAQLAILSLCTLTLLAGCASPGGMQEPLKASDIYQNVCPSDTNVADFEKAPIGTKGQFRDDVLSTCIARVDAKYRDFKTALQQEYVGTNLAVDILSLGLAGGAVLASGSGAKDLAAGATAVIGVGAAVNKDVFYQQALPAIESSMDTNRDKIHTLIVQSEAKDSNAVSYTLSSARSDIAAYENAGNIYAAISELTANANQSAADAKQALQNAKADYTAQLLPADVAQRLQALTDDIYALVEPKDTQKLADIAAALVKANLLVLPAGSLFATQRGDVIFAVVQAVNGAGVTDQKTAMSNISTLLKPITKKDY